MEDLIEGFDITLNGIYAEVFYAPNGVLITNIDYNSPDQDFDELILPYEQFKSLLFENKGAFNTRSIEYQQVG